MNDPDDWMFEDYCVGCHFPHNQACSLTPGCPCCDETVSKCESAGTDDA